MSIASKIIGASSAKWIAAALGLGIVIGAGLGAWASYRLLEVDVLRAQAETDKTKLRLKDQEIADQKSTIDQLNEAARHSAQLAQLERSRADAAEAETAQIQKETDDAAAAAAANAAHRPAVCYLTPAELDGLRKRLH